MNEEGKAERGPFLVSEVLRTCGKKVEERHSTTKEVRQLPTHAV